MRKPRTFRIIIRDEGVEFCDIDNSCGKRHQTVERAEFPNLEQMLEYLTRKHCRGK